MVLILAAIEARRRELEKRITEWRVVDDLVLTGNTWSTFVEEQAGDESRLICISTANSANPYNGLVRTAHEVTKIYAYDGGIDSARNDYNHERGTEVQPESLVIPGTRWYQIKCIDEGGKESWRTIQSGMRDRFRDWPGSYEDNRGWADQGKRRCCCLL